jgi:hypothetical protein
VFTPSFIKDLVGFLQGAFRVGLTGDFGARFKRKILFDGTLDLCKQGGGKRVGVPPPR